MTAAALPGGLKRLLRKAKHIALVVLFLLVPVAGAFHPRLGRKEDPEEKEIGAEK